MSWIQSDLYKCLCESKNHLPRSWLALKGLAMLSVAQRSVSLPDTAATHASVK